MSTGRLEAFSDGVMAVAITLLVLDIHVPDVSSGQSLGHALARQWPIYAAYVTSFITIGIIWINHHAIIARLREADHAVLILNLFLLMTVSVIPFATSLLARYLKQGHGDHLAAAIYGAVLLAMAIAFTLLQRYIVIAHPRLLKRQLPADQRALIFRRTITGLVPYVVATALAPVSAYATLVIAFAMAAFYALPVAISVDLAT